MPLPLFCVKQLVPTKQPRPLGEVSTKTTERGKTDDQWSPLRLEKQALFRRGPAYDVPSITTRLSNLTCRDTCYLPVTSILREGDRLRRKEFFPQQGLTTSIVGADSISAQKNKKGTRTSVLFLSKCRKNCDHLRKRLWYNVVAKGEYDMKKLSYNIVTQGQLNHTFKDDIQVQFRNNLECLRQLSARNQEVGDKVWAEFGQTQHQAACYYLSFKSCVRRMFFGDDWVEYCQLCSRLFVEFDPHEALLYAYQLGIGVDEVVETAIANARDMGFEDKHLSTLLQYALDNLLDQRYKQAVKRCLESGGVESALACIGVYRNEGF